MINFSKDVSMTYQYENLKFPVFLNFFIIEKKINLSRENK